MEWMLMPLRKYADFSGRSRRKEYWMFFLLNMIVYLIGGAILLIGMPWNEMSQSGGDYSAAASVGTNGGTGDPGIMFWVGCIILGLWVLGTLIPNIAVHVRRFHDQDKSGWMYLLNFIPYVGGLIIIVFMFMEGTRGPNRYGNDPKGANVADVFS